MHVLTPTGVTDLGNGRYHGVAVAGNNLYTIYQPDPTSTSAFVLQAESAAAPEKLSWQSLGAITLASATMFHGLHVATQGFPKSSVEVTPSLWFSTNGDPRYITLDPSASPYRSRADTHRVQTSGSAFMSTLEFPEPLTLTRLVVYTSEDRVSGDEWQISFVDQNGDDVNVGTPIRSGAVRHERAINRHDITRLSLHVAFTGTSSASRVPPAIKRIELYGDLSTGNA